MAKSAMKRDQQKFTLLLLLPALLTIIIFTSLPALTTLSYSFFHWTGFQRGSFAGIENFRRLFAFPFRDSLFMAMRHNTLVFIGILIIQTSLGILIAYALYRLKRGQ